MKKQLIKKIIFEKEYDGIIAWVPVSDLPKDLLPTDMIDIQREAGNYSENNSWDAFSKLIVFREMEETDEELEERRIHLEKLKAENKKKRFEQYQKLKKEFE